MSSAVRDEMGIAKAFMDLYARMAADPAAIANAVDEPLARPHAPVAVELDEALRHGCAAGGRARQGRLALQGRGLVEELPLRLDQAVLPHQRAPYPRGGGEGRRAAGGIGEEGRVLHPAVRRRARALELPADQPAGAARDGGERRPEPGARAEEPARRPREGRRAAAHLDDRRERFPARQERRHHARQGGVPDRPHAAHPVRAAHRAGVPAPARHHPALDQQVLHPRPAREEFLHPLGGAAGAYGVRHLRG